MGLIYGGPGIQNTLRGLPSNVFSLAAGNSTLIPAGSWAIGLGPYLQIQKFDPISTVWRPEGAGGDGTRFVNSDGVNWRVANVTGCVVAAEVTTAGSGYTSAPTVTDNGGSATYLAIVGGAVGTSPTIANGGSGYTYAPLIQIDAPPSPGVQATGTCTISSGAVNAITITNQGAGYTQAPTISIVNDPRDTTGSGAVITATLTGSGTVTAVLVTNNGTAVSSVPTLSFSGGGGTSAAATAIMCFTTTAYTVTSAGSGYVGNVLITGMGVRGTGSAAYTNPYIQGSFVRSRPAFYAGALSSTGVTTAGQTLYDGGMFPVVPTGYVAGYSGTTVTSAAQVSFTCGGVTDTFVMIGA